MNDPYVGPFLHPSCGHAIINLHCTVAHRGRPTCDLALNAMPILGGLMFYRAVALVGLFMVSSLSIVRPTRPITIDYQARTIICVGSHSKALSLSLSLYTYICIYIYICVCILYVPPQPGE